MNYRATLTLILAFLLYCNTAAAQTARTRVEWEDGQAQAELTVDATVPEGTETVSLPLAVYDADDNRLWQTTAEIDCKGGIPFSTTVELPEDAVEGSGERRLDVAISSESLGLEYAESVYFSRPDAAIQSYGLRREQQFPAEQMTATVAFNEIDNTSVEQIEVLISVLDARENVVRDRLERVKVGKAPTYYEFDVTPDKDFAGPFTLRLEVDNEVLGLLFQADKEFAFANVLVPVSSLESDDKYLWGPKASSRGSYTDVPVKHPVVEYDEEVALSGRQALRIDYRQGSRFATFGRQVLPGLPVAARVNVRGNDSGDQLYVRWRDHWDDARARWDRNPQWQTVKVCDLDFGEWRQFRIPVFGEGLQHVSASGMGSNPEKIDAPIYFGGFEIRSRRPPKGEEPRTQSVWIDDLFVETQARRNEQLTLELRADTTERLLHEEAQLYVSVGNGSNFEVNEGRLRMAARDRHGAVIYDRTITDLHVNAGDFQMVELPLKGVWNKSPAGPVRVSVNVAAPEIAGLRAKKEITFKNATSYGVFWDFEHPAVYNGYGNTVSGVAGAGSTYSGGAGAETTDGGAEGSKGALRFVAEPDGYQTDEGVETKSSVILHPALPGKVDRLDMKVKVEGGAVRLQPVLMDRGYTGDMDKHFNAFWPDPIRVDHQDWQRVEIVAPPIPPRYGEANRRYMKEPYYPLNLTFMATALGEEPVTVFIDRIRVHTHLPAEKELMADVIYNNDAKLHEPGSPLELQISNFSETSKTIALSVQLTSFQDVKVLDDTEQLTVKAGDKITYTLVDELNKGVYEIEAELRERDALKDDEGEPYDLVVGLHDYVQVINSSRFFGEKPLDKLHDLPELRRNLDMMMERVYLDWDQFEPVPHFYQYRWFRNEVESTSQNGIYEVSPILGFSADWAGPSTQDRIERGAYQRYIGDYMQVPIHHNEWSNYVREAVREFAGEFDQWIFWQNPDVPGGPQSIPAERYPRMLKAVKRWVSVHDPDADVVAGGFHIDHALPYLDRIEDPEKLDFDRMTVQMSLGDLSPEGANVEGFLDELNLLLDLDQTGREVQVVDMDWAIGDHITPMQQVAYHVRAMLFLNSRGAPPHQFGFLNQGHEFEGTGVLYRDDYGNTSSVQTLKDMYAPKPAYLALMYAKQFLDEWTFDRAVVLPEKNLRANRAFMYRNDEGQIAVVIWRTEDDERTYEVPRQWHGGRFEDSFGFSVDVSDGLRVIPIPIFITLPGRSDAEKVAHEMRTMQPSDGADKVLMNLHVAEEASRNLAGYAGTHKGQPVSIYGKIPGGRNVTGEFYRGVEKEEFEFSMPEAGNALLTRRWHYEGEGQKLHVSLNDGPSLGWDLTEARIDEEGVRESTFVLRGCKKGNNRVEIDYDQPGNVSGWRVTELDKGYVELAQWGVLSARQSRGKLERFTSAVGTPLVIGNKTYSSGLGTHAVSIIEVPLDGQFEAFEVTVGVDASTDGSGSVQCEIHVDGEEKVTTEVLGGFSEPVTLEVDELGDARRLFLIARDAGDGVEDDLVNWVDGKLFLKD